MTHRDKLIDQAARVAMRHFGEGEEMIYAWRQSLECLVDAGWRPPNEVDGPPKYLALDLWMALTRSLEGFSAYYDRNGWGGTWAALIWAVREVQGEQPCGEMTDGEPCVLLPHPKSTPHYGASDVGTSEPVPWTWCNKTLPGTVAGQPVEVVAWRPAQDPPREFTAIPVLPSDEMVERVAKALWWDEVRDSFGYEVSQDDRDRIWASIKDETQLDGLGGWGHMARVALHATEEGQQ